MSETYDVIVVGGGLAGLAAGATARRAGASAVVLDGHGLGGRARCATRDGYTFNMGAHALYLGSTGVPVLRELGIEPKGAKPPLERYQALRAGERFVLPTSPGTVLKTKLFGARAKAQFGKLMLSIPRLDHRHYAGQSAADWIADHDLRPEVADAVGALVRIGSYAGDLTAMSADAAVHQLKAATAAGVLYLDGGWDQLTHALAALVPTRPDTKVKTIEATHDKVAVTTEDGETLTAKSVVLALGTPVATAALLPDDPQWGDLGEPVTAACLDVGTRRVPDPGYVLGIDVPMYGTTQSPPAQQTPPGHPDAAVVSVLRYGARSAELDRPDMESMLRHVGVSEDDIVVQRFLARMVVAGTAPRPQTGGMAGRPAVTDTGLPGVFMAGDWVGPDGLLADAALASGQAAARLAVRTADRASTMVA
jgi:phytoene dehydrogenase-like protein